MLVRHAGDTAIAARLQAELTTLGWRLLEAPVPPPDAYGTWLRQAGAEAALRVLATNTVELWFLNADTGTPTLERLTFAGAPGEGVLALRAIETLRARLLRGKKRLRDSAAEEPPEEPSESEPPNFWIGVGPVLSYSPGGVGTLTHGSLAVHYELPPPFVLHLVAWAPILSRELRVAEGQFELKGALFGGSLKLVWATEVAGVGFGIGAAAAVLDVVGHAEPPYRGENATAVTTMPLGLLSAFYVLADPVRLFLDVTGGYSLPSASVHVRGSADQELEVATWGSPLLAGSLGVEVGM